MSNSSFNDCSPIDYYAKQKYAQLEEQIYNLKQNNAQLEKQVNNDEQKTSQLEEEVSNLYNLVNTYLRSTCINPVFSLIDYTTEIVAPTNKETIPFGTITYYQTVITNSFNGDRVWTFTLGGNIFAPSFWINYQFDPNCVVPNGFDFSALKDINFYIDGSTTEYEPLQGTIIVDNIGLPVSDAPLVVSLEWNASTALLIFKFSITRQVLNQYDNYRLQASQIDAEKFGQNNPKSLFINLTIRDTVRCVPGISC